MNRVVYWNGKFIPESEARLSIYDSAFMFGDTVFEMTRSFNKVTFKLREHLERLYRSIRYLRIPLEMTIDEMEKTCFETQEANEPAFAPDDEHRLMINITRGLLSIYEGIDGASKGPNVIISDFPLRWTTAGMGKLFDIGINCVVPSQRTIPASLLDPKVKNRSRIHYLMANIQASQMKGENNWPILLDPDGFIAEGTGYNFFIVKNREVITSEPQNILRGISRAYIRALSCYGFRFTEKNIDPYDVYESDEAFVTGTPFCMLPVVSLDGIMIGNGNIGPLYKEILGEWGEDVGVDIKAQIQSWDNGAKEGVSPYQFK
jgi:branched-chain amino acid aminotransferase